MFVLAAMNGIVQLSLKLRDKATSYWLLLIVLARHQTCLFFPKICNEVQCFQAPRHFCPLVTLCRLVEFVMN